VSPCSTNLKYTPRLSAPTIRHHLTILQGVVHARLDGPHFFNTIPNLPPSSEHFRITIPFLNHTEETLKYFIEGISVTLLLGDKGHENTLTLCYVGYLIFQAVKSLHATFSPYIPFPPKIAKLTTQTSIGNLISVKKVRFSKKSNGSSTNTNICPLLGVVITKTAPLGNLLTKAIHHVCITNSSPLQICGSSPEQLSITLHDKPPEVANQHTLAKQINITHNSLHDTSS
jgi:hypothetical protein